MGGMCSACSDGTSEAQAKQRGAKQGLLQPEPRTSQSASETAEGAPQPSTAGASADTQDLSRFDSLFEDLARFLKTLPTKSKKHIWEHAVKARQKDGTKIVVTTTTSKDQITRLLCDCVIVYVKYLDRKRKPLSTRQVVPHVEPAAQWIYDNHGSLERNRFETDKTYFADMLEEYQHFVK